MSKISIIGIDLAKHVFQLCAMTASGRVVFSKKLKRPELLPFLAQTPQTLIAIEACGGAHHWAREIQKLGHHVSMIHPRYVKPFVQVNKNDARDAQAIAEAASRESMPTVSVKSVEQQELQCLHRVRERLIRERTSIGNELRGILHEFGIVIAKGHAAVRKQVSLILEDATNGLGVRGRALIADLQTQWLEQEERIQQYDQQVKQAAKTIEVCKRLQSIPGIGPVISTLLYVQMGNVQDYASGRHFAASLGLVPKQHSSGGKDQLMGISKQGNKHVRRQLVHGARSAYRALLKSKHDSRLKAWLMSKPEKHPNVVIVALANKLARISWAVVAKGGSYQA